MSVGSREIAVSSCPSCVQDLFYAGAGVLRSDAEEEKTRFAQTLEDCNRVLDRKGIRRKDRPETKFDRLERVRSMYPGCEIQACTVDTENVFRWREDMFRISDSLSQYKPQDTDSGEYYAMDRALVVHTGQAVHCFLDQSGVLIDPGMIEMIG